MNPNLQAEVCNSVEITSSVGSFPFLVIHQVSSILIHLFATSHAFRSRLPIPQFLPSPRVAFEAWEARALRGLMAPGSGTVAPNLDIERLTRIASREGGGKLHSDLEVLCESSRPLTLLFPASFPWAGACWG